LLDISALVSNHQINSDKINDRGRQTINKLGRIYSLGKQQQSLKKSASEKIFKSSTHPEFRHTLNLQDSNR